MNEYEIATKRVFPYLRETLHWPDELIRGYGRVPVQVGGSTVWADLVCYISEHQKAVPWLLVEVKRPGEPLEQAVPQAESYALILGARFFAVTDGDKFLFYICGDSQGKNIPLDAPPPLPSSDYLDARVDFVSFPPLIDNLIDMFFVGLRNEKKFLDDTRHHEESVRKLNQKLFSRIDALSAEKIKRTISDYMMMKTPNRNLVFAQIDKDLKKFKRVLNFINSFEGDPVRNLNALLRDSPDLQLRGAGIFFITQLLAGAHPNKYVVLEENVSKALRYLGVTDILVKNDTANGYIYVNEICKKLYHEKLKSRLREYGFGLPATHNFLWHYYVNFRRRHVWQP